MADQTQQDSAGDAPSDTGQADYGSAGGQADAGTAAADADLDEAELDDEGMDDADLGLEEDPDVTEVFGDDPQPQA